MKSLQGSLLVASPYLPDPHFYRSVVLIVRHDEEHALGLVLNRPGNATIGRVWEQVSDLPCGSDEPIRVGGPCEGPLMALHQIPELGENEVRAGIHFSTGRQHLYGVVGQSQSPFVIFSGYAGWGAGQLEVELEIGGWMIVDAEPHHIFRNRDDLWKDLTQEIGSDILLSAFDLKHLPQDPSLN
jgi:putative transcriptional regulator